MVKERSADVDEGHHKKTFGKQLVRRFQAFFQDLVGRDQIGQREEIEPAHRVG